MVKNAIINRNMVTQTSTTATAVLEPDVLTPEWYYNTLMEEIEPELTTYNFPTIEKRYEDESIDDQAERLKRYELAFQLFDECLDELELDFSFDAAGLSEGLFELVTNNEDQEKKDAIADIEGALERSDFRA